MKQLIQDLKNGKTLLEEVPAPQVKAGCVLIKTTRSLVSLGTERMLVEFGQASLIDKARQQPDRVKQVLDKMKTEGVIPTLEAVFNKLNQPLPLGYCNVGVVEKIGKEVQGFQVGDRVASNGNHAEYVSIPENLTARIPDNVSDEEATFTVIGSIGLEGVRLCNPTFGETIVVIGLGLIGLVTTDLLKANGCKVIGYDFDQQKVDIALSKGVVAFNPSQGNDPVKFVQQATRDIGADGVIITASNKDDVIIHQAAEMSRQRGRIILVGVIGLNIRRDDFFKKELTFQVSCSYGPGRYDDNYEQKGLDYPIGFVRWTEKRNFETVLNAISSGQLDVKPYISEIVDLNDYQQIYGDMLRKGIIASLIRYPELPSGNISHKIKVSENVITPGQGIMGIIGAGNFTSATMIPALGKINAKIKYIASSGGLSAAALAKKASIPYAVTDINEILNDNDVTGVLITTRHNLHAALIFSALQARKNVFVEKPLCLNQTELDSIIQALDLSGKNVTVGFNRRFSPHSQKVKEHVGSGPMNIVATMNAGYIPPESWVHDLTVGGGRIVGEACHFIDLCSYLVGSEIVSVCMNAMGNNTTPNTDNASLLLRYEDGSNAVINYFANGAKSYAKERVEVYSQRRVFVIDNWRITRGYGVKKFKTFKSKQDKGHYNQFKQLNESWRLGGKPIISFSSIINTTKATFAAIESLKSGSWVTI